MRLTLLFCIAILLFTASASAQYVGLPGGAADHASSPHLLPYGASGATVELVVVGVDDALRRAVGSVVVRLVEAPAWMRIEPLEVALDEVALGQDATARFGLVLAGDAPVGETGTVKFDIVSADSVNRVLAKKVVRLAVASPQSFKVVGAYPNPLRLTASAQARITYELPAEAEVKLEVYDVLGRRVSVAEVGLQQAGRHETYWDPTTKAVGTYLWQLVVDGPLGRKVERGRLTLVR